MGLSVCHFSLLDLIILNSVSVPAARVGGCHLHVINLGVERVIV